MSQSQQNHEPDRDRAPQLLAAFWVPFPIIVAFVGARMIVRYKMKSTGVDDWLMVAALVTLVVSLAFSSIYVLNGGARHIYYIKPEELEIVLKYNFLSQPFGIAASTFSKMSVAMFLAVRLMGGPHMVWRKRFLYATTVVYVILAFVACLVIFIQCKPPRALWEKVPGSKCWKAKYRTDISITYAAFGSYYDFLLALIPITVIWGLTLSTRRKIGLCFLLGLGVLGSVCAAVKTAELKNFSNRTDFTWAVFSIFIWSSVEQTIVIVCGSIPAVKPLFDYFVFNKPIGGSRTTTTAKSKGSGAGSVMGLGTLKSRNGNATEIAGDDDERRLWPESMGGAHIFVQDSYGVSSDHISHASTRETA